MRILQILLVSLLLTGCDMTEVFAELDYVDDADKTSISFLGHEELCKETGDIVFCSPSESIGDIQPTWQEVMNVVNELSSNFTYVAESNDDWSYNLTVNQTLKDDCDGVMLTLAYHLIEDLGIDRKHIMFVATYPNSKYHVFLAVNTSDRGWTHFDYGNSGQPLEEEINWYQSLVAEDFGVYGWKRESVGDFR